MYNKAVAETYNSCKLTVSKWRHMASNILVNVRSGNGFCPRLFVAKSLPKSILFANVIRDRSDISIQIPNFTSKKRHVEMSSSPFLPFWYGLIILNYANMLSIYLGCGQNNHKEMQSYVLYTYSVVYRKFKNLTFYHMVSLGHNMLNQLAPKLWSNTIKKAKRCSAL